ncbi:MAG: universal stress protein [Thermodesulfobacteria bacterium]|nr:universal stress protein [Thermodesulfobacteriota bacterium]
MLGTNTHLMGEIESLLLAVDASEESKGAAQEAVTIALECEAKVYILYVREYYPEVPEALLSALEGIPEEHRKFLEKVKSMVEKEGGQAEIIIRDHPEAWRAIIEEAEKLNVDLIIMGKRGHTGLKKLFMGSITEKVIGYAPCKVMVVPKDVVIHGEVVLVATDGSYYAKKAEKEALSMGKRCSTLKKIIALSVARRESDLPKAAKVLEAFKALAQEETLPPRVKIETMEVVGDPPHMIVRVAEDEGADLILMGEYGRTGLQKFIMGSTTAKVIGLSQKSAVLVVK